MFVLTLCKVTENKYTEYLMIWMHTVIIGEKFLDLVRMDEWQDSDSITYAHVTQDFMFCFWLNKVQISGCKCAVSFRFNPDASCLVSTSAAVSWCHSISTSCFRGNSEKYRRKFFLFVCSWLQKMQKRFYCENKSRLRTESFSFKRRRRLEPSRAPPPPTPRLPLNPLNHKHKRKWAPE